MMLLYILQVIYEFTVGWKDIYWLLYTDLYALELMKD